MKIKKVIGREGQPITFLTPKVKERCVKLPLGVEVEVPDDIGYEILGKYPGEVKVVEEKPAPKKEKLMRTRKDKSISADEIVNK